MKTPIITMLILSSASICVAKDITFAYDAAGNRISREIFIGTRSDHKNFGDESISEKIGKRLIKIYPNPTKGLIKIELSELSKSTEITLNVYDLNGCQIYSFKGSSLNITEIDLSRHNNGIFILEIGIDCETTTYKIIKN